MDSAVTLRAIVMLVTLNSVARPPPPPRRRRSEGSRIHLIWPQPKSRKAVSKTSSRPRHASVSSTAIAACSRIADYDIHDLARNATFEETCYLLWHGRLPNRAELGDLQSQLAAARPLPEPILRLMKMLPPSDGMDALRTLTSALGHYDPDAHDNSPRRRIARRSASPAQIASLVATWGRMQQGGGPIAPDPAMGHAANFLYMLFGRRPNADRDPRDGHRADAARGSRAQCLDLRRARRRRDAHRHPLRHRRRHRHAEGTAARRRQRRSDEDADRDRPGRAGGTHRRVRARASSRARRRSPASATASTTPRIRAPRTCGRCRRSSGSRPATAAGSRCRERIEALVKAEKKLYPNVDFYSASTYYTMGIADRSLHADLRRQPHLGWTAHVLEQLANNRLIRPRADYTGPAYPQTWLPLEQR